MSGLFVETDAFVAELDAAFEALDAASAKRLEAVHQTMHDAIRALCTVMRGQPGLNGDLDAFEASQANCSGCWPPTRPGSCRAPCATTR